MGSLCAFDCKREFQSTQWYNNIRLAVGKQFVWSAFEHGSGRGKCDIFLSVAYRICSRAIYNSHTYLTEIRLHSLNGSINPHVGIGTSIIDKQIVKRIDQLETVNRTKSTGIDPNAESLLILVNDRIPHLCRKPTDKFIAPKIVLNPQFPCYTATFSLSPFEENLSRHLKITSKWFVVLEVFQTLRQK